MEIKRKTNKTDNQINRYHRSVIVVVVLIAVAVTLSLSLAITQRASKTMERKVSVLVNANNYQQVMNVNNYLDQIKETASLFFSDEVYYKYDETSDAMDDFEKIQIESTIQNRIQDLGVLKNFSDFGVVYSDGYDLGWISDNTYGMFEKSELYKVLAEHITDTKTESGWFAINQNDYERIYYVKRLNPNAVLFTSFYTREFDSVFVVPEDMQGMVIRLVDDKGIVIYSTDDLERGETLDSEISGIIADKNNTLVLGDKYLVTSNSCNGNLWSVVCSIPTADIMSEINSLKIYTYSISAIMTVVVIILAFLIIKGLSKPMDRLIEVLQKQANLDQLTGLLNKMSFREIVSSIMKNGSNGDKDVFVMLDMDNFKYVNDNLGHAEGDKVLVRLASLIRRVFSSDTVCSRVGGDEFALFYRENRNYADTVSNKMTEAYNRFCEEFNKEFAEEIEKCGLSVSLGIAIAGYGEMDFDTIYKAADSALYESKRSGKNKMSFYDGRKVEDDEKA